MNKSLAEILAEEHEGEQPRVRVDRGRLELIMRCRGYTNGLLADKLGKHYNSVTRLKRTQSIPLAELGQLCDVLGCHPFDLLVAEGYPEPFFLAPASH